MPLHAVVYVKLSVKSRVRKAFQDKLQELTWPEFDPLGSIKNLASNKAALEEIGGDSRYFLGRLYLTIYSPASAHGADVWKLKKCWEAAYREHLSGETALMRYSRDNDFLNEPNYILCEGTEPMELFGAEAIVCERIIVR